MKSNKITTNAETIDGQRRNHFQNFLCRTQLDTKDRQVTGRPPSPICAVQVGRSVGRSVARSLGCSLDRSVGRSLGRSDALVARACGAWHVSGGEGWCANTTNKRVMVTHQDGRQTVEEIKDDLGVTSDQYGARLRSQGVNDAQKVSSYGEGGDTNKNSGGFGSPRRGGRVQSGAPASASPRRGGRVQSGAPPSGSGGTRGTMGVQGALQKVRESLLSHVSPICLFV